MNKKKTTLKGFTLIELIIVLAIFSVIMMLVMSFIDPVSKLMTKTSVRERTSAYVDNIGEYVSKSIRHAQNLWVYENGLTGNEEDLVTDFVNTYYDGAVDENFNPINLKVHVLKLINEDDGSLKAGRIYESVYDFKAGTGKPGAFKYLDKTTYQEVTVFPPGMTEEEKELAYIKCESKEYDETKGFPEASIKSRTENVSVINDEHFKDYSYYYKLGMYTFDPDHDVYSYMTEDEQKNYDKVQEKYFYSRLNRMKNSSGAIINDGIGEYQLVMNIVSYMSEEKDKIQSVKNYTYEDDLGNDVAVSSFRSPAAMNSVGITFKNVQLQEQGNVVSYYRIKFDNDGDKLDVNGNKIPSGDITTKPDIEPVRNSDTPDPFRRVTEGTSDNIYMIFTVPSEIMDTEWKDLTPSEPAPEPTTGGILVA